MLSKKEKESFSVFSGANRFSALAAVRHKAGIVQDPDFEIMCDVGGKVRFHLKASNGLIIAESQSYKAIVSAEKGICLNKEECTKGQNY